MRIFSIISAVFAVLLMSGEAVAQTSDVRLWSEGALKWSDFCGASPLESDSISFLQVELAVKSVKEKDIDGQASERFEAQAIMHRNASFADASKCTRQRLRYHQLQFDLLELLRRRLQLDINTGISAYETDRRLNEYQSIYRQRLRRIDSDTRWGTDSAALQAWSTDVLRQLTDMGNPSAASMRPGGFVYGLYAGVGGMFPTGSLTDNFKGCAAFTIGLTAGYNRFRIKADVSYGQPSFNNDTMFNRVDELGRQLQGNAKADATLLCVGTQLGYCVYSGERFAITPNVGGFWTGYSWETQDLNWVRKEDTDEFVPKIVGSSTSHLRSYNWIASVDFDIKFHTTKSSNMPIITSGRRQSFTSSVRITPFVARASYHSVPSVKGYQVGFCVSYCGLARSLHL